ncbi:MAG: hypothetical protein U5L07_00305 [Desulfobacterales bacterium]|nr:hypothetical protein [Desulfobacterales bacterium]
MPPAVDASESRKTSKGRKNGCGLLGRGHGLCKPVRALTLLHKFLGLFLDAGAHDISGKFRMIENARE